MIDWLRKEFLFHRKVFYINYGMMIVYLIWFSSYSGSLNAYFSVAALMSGIMPVTFQAREDRFRLTALTALLPLSRDGVIRAKYATLWLLMGVGILFSLVVPFVSPLAKISPASLFSSGHPIAFLLLLNIATSFLFPFIIRFGWMGTMVFMVVIQLAGAVLFLISVLLRGQANPFRSVMRAMMGSIRYLMGHPITVSWVLLAAVAVFLLQYLSLKTSQFIYRRKDL